MCNVYCKTRQEIIYRIKVVDLLSMIEIIITMLLIINIGTQ